MAFIDNIADKIFTSISLKVRAISRLKIIPITTDTEEIRYFS
jgi:hypothetical protein